MIPILRLPRSSFDLDLRGIVPGVYMPVLSAPEDFTERILRWYVSENIRRYLRCCYTGAAAVTRASRHCYRGSAPDYDLSGGGG